MTCIYIFIHELYDIGLVYICVLWDQGHICTYMHVYGCCMYMNVRPDDK